jgi:hypothetical protein
VVCSSFRARASAGEQTATAVGRCPFPVTMSAPRTRGSHDAARTDGGVIPCLGLDSLWRILKKRRVDQYKRMQLNPEATFAAVTHLLCSRPPAVQPNGAPRPLFAHVFEKPMQMLPRELHATTATGTLLPLCHRFAKHPEHGTASEPSPVPCPSGAACASTERRRPVCGGGTLEPSQPFLVYLPSREIYPIRRNLLSYDMTLLCAIRPPHD